MGIVIPCYTCTVYNDKIIRGFYSANGGFNLCKKKIGSDQKSSPLLSVNFCLSIVCAGILYDHGLCWLSQVLAMPGQSPFYGYAGLTRITHIHCPLNGYTSLPGCKYVIVKDGRSSLGRFDATVSPLTSDPNVISTDHYIL